MNEDQDGDTASSFDDWGIPTADALISVKNAVGDLPIIASGGIRSGADIAKAMALGAAYSGMALPLLAPAMESSEAVKKKIEMVIKELKIAMFGCGAIDLDRLMKGQCAQKKG